MHFIDESKLIAIHELMEWITENGADWTKICNIRTNPLPAREYKRLLNKLRQENFYEIILVMMFQGAPKLKAMAQSTMLTMLKKDCDDYGISLLKKIS